MGMTSRHYSLPSLNALATFEASARHRSLKRAAEELNVTPGAVSRQIRALEEELGAQLFARAATGVTLTAEGEALYCVLASTFRGLAETTEAIRSGEHQRQVTVACTHAFARCWLMPRMNDFRRRFPDICVNHLVTDDAREYRRAEVDLRIRYGFGAWTDETPVLLFEDAVYPVAAPEFCAGHRGAVAADLPNLPLLHVDWVDSDWTDWDELFRRGQIARGALRGRRFSTFELALQASQDGQGVVIGWHRLIRPLLASGALVPFTDLLVRAPGAYYLTWNSNVALRDATVAVRDWLLQQAADEAADPLPVAFEFSA